MTSPIEPDPASTDTPIYDELTSAVPGFADLSVDAPAAAPGWPPPDEPGTA